MAGFRYEHSRKPLYSSSHSGAQKWRIAPLFRAIQRRPHQPATSPRSSAELELVAHDLQPRTIFFGGGNAIAAQLAPWEQILRALSG